MRVMTYDAHRTAPQSVRMPADLQQWYRQHAETSGQRVNALLVTILREWAEERGYEAEPPRGRGPARRTIAEQP